MWECPQRSEVGIGSLRDPSGCEFPDIGAVN